MSKWEEKYEEYKNGLLDARISELKDKVDNSKTTREEFKEYEKLIKIKASLPQVKNIVKYRDKLKEDLKEMNEELKHRESLDQASKSKSKLEFQLLKLQEEYDKTVKALKDKNITDNERKELENKKTEITGKIGENNKEYAEQEQILRKGLGEKRKLSGVSSTELENKKFEIQTKVSKCNLVAKNLLNGLSWDSIDMKLDNWKDKKFTSKDDKLKEDLKRARQEKVDKFKLDIKDIDKEEIEDSLDKDNKQELPDRTFADKHPRLAKIGKFFKGLKDKIFKKEETKIEGKEDDKKEESKEDEKTEEKSFKEYIKEIAEKGMDGIEAEEKLARQEAAKEKLAKMREANRKAEAEKFGQDYADKSDYRNNDDGIR